MASLVLRLQRLVCVLLHGFASECARRQYRMVGSGESPLYGWRPNGGSSDLTPSVEGAPAEPPVARIPETLAQASANVVQGILAVGSLTTRLRPAAFA